MSCDEYLSRHEYCSYVSFVDFMRMPLSRIGAVHTEHEVIHIL